ncbi:MAG TPA: Holliday junction branch migration DNA helicase RuvB [Candidatus Krumholzibacteria bacterium]|nr:Holliday junction branch migration DNA helicase RuvB [Candidatus Krumholzibacteria bacterium]
MTERLTSPAISPEDAKSDALLRPRKLEEFVGQTELKENLRVFIDAAKQRGEALDHVLLYGPPGLGKTTLAHIVANELEVPIKITSGPAFQNAAELLGVLSHIEKNQVVFIDEIHRLPRILEEHMYQAMDSLKCELIVDKGPNARHYTLNIEPFTLIGATTRAGMITAPLRDRFGVVMRLDFYTPQELCTIIKRSAGILDIEISDDGADEIARRARGTPRIANRLLKRTRDFAQVQGKKSIDREAADFALKRLRVDQRGLDEMDRRILISIVQKFGGGPVGIQSLAVAVSEETETLEDVYEPFLIQQGFLQRTPRGRIATPLALAHLGLAASAPVNPEAENRLF